jgi:PAS domain S-box-containing protein
MAAGSGHEQANAEKTEALGTELPIERDLLEQAPDSVLRIDVNGTIEYLSRAPTGAAGSFLGRNWLDFIAPRYQPGAQAAQESAIQRGESSTIDVMASGNATPLRWYSCHLGPFRAAGHIEGALIVLRDVTEKRQSEAQLVATDRMASIGTLAAGVAHEINNPLAAVIANLELAINDVEALALGAATVELIEELRDAREAADRVRLIVRDLKLFSRAEEERRGPVNVRDVIESTLRMTWNEIRHRAKLVKAYDEVPMVVANEARLGQVFLNLVVNAAHSIPAGRAESNEIRVSTRFENERVVVEIADTGAGMSPETAKHVFTPFFSAKMTGAGTGLGLPICLRIVEDLGGEIRVASREGVGSTFTVLLPASDTPSEIPPSERRAAAKPTRRGRVLVVDDEQMVAMAVRRSLASHHDVVTLNVTEEALALLRSGERFDVILCDVMMPNMTGVDFYREVERVAPEEVKKIVFLTGGAFAIQTREFLDRIPNLRVEKPFTPEGLRTLVSDRLRLLGG